MAVQSAGAPQSSPALLSDQLPDRFAAFSFVDCITQIDGVRRVTGRYTIPADATYFPVSLVAEAIGQLAAWVAMSTVDFRFRPVAALAGDTRIFACPKPGDTLELIVDIESCDEESITYRGHAMVGATMVLELLDTLGSMLDIAEFDDPAALAADFLRLTSGGRDPGAFKGVPRPGLTDVLHEPGAKLHAQLSVPEHAPFFNDHFPRRPVFPATLMLDSQLQLAERIATELAGQPVHVTRITNVKVRAFTSPGATLHLFAESAAPGEDDPEPILIKVGAQADGRTIAGAKMFFAPDSGEHA
jgi:3-hydroxymyristoyl/3-hydroxydecanoyl-(acyl carrier protein) dehydratase